MAKKPVDNRAERFSDNFIGSIKRKAELAENRQPEPSPRPPSEAPSVDHAPSPRKGPDTHK
jgi:hypothetical protein